MQIIDSIHRYQFSLYQVFSKFQMFAFFDLPCALTGVVGPGGGGVDELQPDNTIYNTSLTINVSQ